MRPFLSRAASLFFLGRGLLIFVVFASIWLVASAFLGNARRVRLATTLCRRGLGLAGVAVETTGAEDLRAGGPCVIVANHVNLADPFVLQAALGLPLTALMYVRYFATPLWGRIATRLHLIPIDNHSLFSSKRAVSDAERALAEGRWVLVMPEGKRPHDGRLGPFFAGAACIARRARVPIQPVAQIGAFEVYHDAHVRPGSVRVSVLPPVTTEVIDREPPRALMGSIRERLAAALERG